MGLLFIIRKCACTILAQKSNINAYESLVLRLVMTVCLHQVLERFPKWLGAQEKLISACVSSPLGNESEKRKKKKRQPLPSVLTHYCIRDRKYISPAIVCSALHQVEKHFPLRLTPIRALYPDLSIKQTLLLSSTGFITCTSMQMRHSCASHAILWSFMSKQVAVSHASSKLAFFLLRS